MKTFLVFLNSFLLAFEPTAWSLSKTAQAGMKDFLETTEITRRQVTFKEFYDKIKSRIPKGYAPGLEEYVKQNGDVLMPKFTVNKVKGENGEEDVQLSFITPDKKSMLFQFTGRGNLFAKVGDVKINNSDVSSFKTVVEKVATAVPGGKPMTYKKVKDFGILSAAELNALPDKERKAYFKQYRQLLESMERLDAANVRANSTKSKKTSSYFFDWLVPGAYAGLTPEQRENEKYVNSVERGGACLYAGWMADYGHKKPSSVGKDFECGGYDSQFRKTPPEGPDRKSLIFRMSPDNKTRQVLCNPAVYGSDPAVYVNASEVYATAACNKLASKYDAFPTPKDTQYGQKSWEDTKKQILGKLKVQRDFCSNVSPNGATSPKIQGVLVDQAQSCNQLVARITEIEQVTCAMARDAKETSKFKGNVCEEKVVGEAPPTPVTPAPPVQAGGGGAGAGADGANADAPKPGPVSPPGTIPEDPTFPSVNATPCADEGFTNDPAILEDLKGQCAGGSVQNCSMNAEWKKCICTLGFEEIRSGSVIVGCRKPAEVAPPVAQSEHRKYDPNEGFSKTSPWGPKGNSKSWLDTWGPALGVMIVGGAVIWGATAWATKSPSTSTTPAATPVPLVAPPPPRTNGVR